MKNLRLFYKALLMLPLLTVPFLGRNSFKKYLPAAIFICTVTTSIDYSAFIIELRTAFCWQKTA